MAVHRLPRVPNCESIHRKCDLVHLTMHALPARPLQSDQLLLIGLKCDLALLTVIAKGNDYVPGLAGVELESGTTGV